MGQKAYLGIDLGTTNSAACVFDGEQLIGIRSATGEALTPSVVRIDGRGNVTVGSRAHRFLNRDSGNTRAEFKRLMGSSTRLHFASAGVDKLPEELAAEVLRSLRQDVEAQLGFAPARAVVAVPALFELPQIRATSEAARLAGFERVETIQEPVASALASGWTAEESRGAWLVYDLGGGTFDASLLETQEGLLRVVGHDGDNFLGGRDFDLAVVEWLIVKLKEATGVELSRANPAHTAAIAKLKVSAEEAKIELSRAPHEVSIVVDDLELEGAAIDSFEQPLSRAELERLTAPLVERSVRVCERLLKSHGIHKLERMVLVGGPTMMPFVRERLTEAFGASFGSGLDPMLMVAQGAALFSATSGLDARPTKTNVSADLGPRLWLQYPAMTPDTSPFVVGRVLETSDRVASVRFSRADGEWQGEWQPVDADGTFAVMISLKRRAESSFRVEVLLASGGSKAASPAEISLVHGVSIGEPPLARTIGIARADNHVAVYFERGAPLPIRKTFTHRTIESISPSVTDYALRVPIVQGDFPLAHLCRLVGVIQIPASALKAPLPIDSAIELTLEVDRGGALSAKAFLPTQNLMFDHVEQLLAPATSIEKMLEIATELEQRAAAVRGRAFREGQQQTIVALAHFDAALSSARLDLAAARGGDADAAEKARRTLIDCDAELADVEARNAWPELSSRVYSDFANADYWVSAFGTDSDKRALAHAMQMTERGLRARNAGEIERQLKVMRRLQVTSYLRSPDAWSHELDAAANRLHTASDVGKAQKLLQRGRSAEASGNRRELETIVRELWGLLRIENEERTLSFDSGVQ